MSENKENRLKIKAIKKYEDEIKTCNKNMIISGIFSASSIAATILYGMTCVVRDQLSPINFLPMLASCGFAMVETCNLARNASRKEILNDKINMLNGEDVLIDDLINERIKSR